MSHYGETPRSDRGSGTLSRFPLQTIVNNLATNMTAPAEDSKTQHGSESKTIVGTLLGAAAGAALAYAIAKEDSPKSDSHDGPVREVTVRHMVEYRHLSEGRPRSTTSRDSRRPGSDATSHRSPLKIEAPRSPRSEYSVESVRSSRTSRPRPAPLALPAPPSSYAPSAVPSSAREYAPSHRSSRRQSISSGRPPSYSPHEIPLPPSTRASTASRHPPLPPSTRTSSIRSPHDIPLPPSTRTSSIRSPRFPPSPPSIPLPPSRGTSFLSRAPSPPRSERSAHTQSTVRPLTKRNVARVNSGSASDVRPPAAGERGWDELQTVVPDDSISQASERMRRVKREEGHGRKEKKREGRSKTGSSVARSEASRARPEGRQARSSVKVFGFGG
jgi:hypothetical protein